MAVVAPDTHRVFVRVVHADTPVDACDRAGFAVGQEIDGYTVQTIRAQCLGGQSWGSVHRWEVTAEASIDKPPPPEHLVIADLLEEHGYDDAAEFLRGGA